MDTQHALSSDHLPIITTINIRHDYRLPQNRRTFTNYKKADWTQFTEDTESAFAQTTIHTNIHTANRIFTNIILMADKQNIPKGKMHSNCRLLPEDIVCKITQRNNIRRANTCDPALKLLNEEITSDIQKQNIWKEHLDAHWDHRQNTHTLWKTIHGLSNRAPPHTLNTSITFNNKIATTPTHIANCFTKQFTNTVKHATHKTNRHINRATHNIQGYNITLTNSQVQEAIKQSKNNNSQGPDKLNTRHLKHIGPLGLAFLKSMFKTALNKSIIPHTWKLANIVPIPKPNKDTDKGTSYRPISLLSVIAKTLEKSLLPYITANIPNTPMQHGYKTQHSTVTALHTLNNTVVVCLPRPMGRMGRLQFSDLFSQNCQFHHRRLESLEHLMCLIYILLSTTVSNFLDLTDAFFLYTFPFCKYTLHVCYLFNVNLTDSFDVRRSQCRLIE